MIRGEESYANLRPLRASEFPDAEQALGAELLERVGPLPRSEHRRRRVWNALNLGTRAPLLFRLRAWHLALAGVLVTAASSAAVGGLYVAHVTPTQIEMAAAPPAAPISHVSRSRKAAAPSPVARLEEPSVSEPLAEAPLVRAPARKAVEAAPHAKAPASEAEAELLVEAMRARREGDSKRVSELVDEYRAKHPNGSLQEEALILSIESAVSRHAPNAGALAREYLSSFPNGRFAAQARRAASTGSR